jgi:hypothetical protein
MQYSDGEKQSTSDKEPPHCLTKARKNVGKPSRYAGNKKGSRPKIFIHH